MKLVTLGELCEMSSGGTPLRSEARYYTNGTIPWVKIGDIENAEDGVINRTEESITEEGLAAINDRAFAPGTVLFAMYGSVGKVAVAGIPLSTNQAILGIRPDLSRLDAGYLVHWLKSRQHEWEHQARGVALKNLSAGIVKQQKIPLPPLPTQRRIAAVLDKAQALVANDRQTLALYDQLSKSLFLEMFGDPVRNERGWTYRNLSTYTDRIVVGHVGPTSHGYAEEGVPYLRTLNVRVNEVDLSDLNHITETFHGKLRKSVIHEGDVLISRVGVNRGMAAPVPKELEGANCGNIIVVARSSKLHPLFLSHYLNMTFGKGSSFGYSVGSAQGVVNTANVKKWPIIDVPPAEQELFARKMKDVHTQRAQAEQSLRQSEGLFGSLLQSAFAGGLG